MLLGATLEQCSRNWDSAVTCDATYSGLVANQQIPHKPQSQRISIQCNNLILECNCMLDARQEHSHDDFLMRQATEYLDTQWTQFSPNVLT
jgi:hypothetical protein